MPSLPELGIYFSLLLFIVGLFGVMFRKNIIFMMLSVEIMLNAANLAFISASALTNTIDGQVVMFFVMAVAACEAGIGLALIISLYRAKSSIEIDDLRMLRG
ncbi:NADH-quinone oxidoreductase subunit NuoK [Fluviispira multicolorata]|uniref:NADH-quinone oxidoreductase subunit K n=1 Tax=Fluviispira multicolorata TaxID=2654512 RepID=A0A833JD90_9BACT|nr:NADH-quinone oxidoreductase subunit NuoK [Fluviispira multicolorata]KAB8028447.1 NADH-quinone oxidoreductase subunit NuoK [Fluviispira multicolorata]